MSFDHFLKRVQISLDQLSLLIRINAFRFTGYTKKELLWEAYLKLGQQKKTKPAKMLFDPEVKHYKLPELSYDRWKMLLIKLSCLVFRFATLSIY